MNPATTAPLVSPYGPADWLVIAPILVVVVAGLLVVAFDLFLPRAARRPVSMGIAVVGLLAAGVVAATGWGHPYVAFGTGFAAGGFTIAFEEVVLVAALLSILLAYGLGREDQHAGALGLMLWATAGGLVMAGAANFLTIFLGLELLSLALYCLCGIASRPTARESALKYLILSSTASGVMLYGMALIFGATGSVALAAILDPTFSNAFLVMGIGLFLVGIAFKLSLAPFHVWAPDVYEGAPLPVTAFMSVVTKAGVLAIFARFAYAALPSYETTAVLVPIWFVAALSMIVGNVAALAQNDMKRLLAYSGIAQIAYIVASLAGTTASGMRYAIFYLIGYTFMNLGAFAVVALLSKDDGDEGSRLAAYAGLGYRQPVLAAAMAFFLVALAGLPPTVGFTGKFLILASTVHAGYAWLGGVLIVGTAISAYVYFKIIRIMYVRGVGTPLQRAVVPVSLLPWACVAACAVLVFVLGVYPRTVSDVLPLVR